MGEMEDVMKAVTVGVMELSWSGSLRTPSIVRTIRALPSHSVSSWISAVNRRGSCSVGAYPSSRAGRRARSRLAASGPESWRGSLTRWCRGRDRTWSPCWPGTRGCPRAPRRPAQGRAHGFASRIHFLYSASSEPTSPPMPEQGYDPVLSLGTGPSAAPRSGTHRVPYVSPSAGPCGSPPLSRPPRRGVDDPRVSSVADVAVADPRVAAERPRGPPGVADEELVGLVTDRDHRVTATRPRPRRRIGDVTGGVWPVERVEHGQAEQDGTPPSSWLRTSASPTAILRRPDRNHPSPQAASAASTRRRRLLGVVWPVHLQRLAPATERRRCGPERRPRFQLPSVRLQPQ